MICLQEIEIVGSSEPIYKVIRSNIYAGTLMEPFEPAVKVVDSRGQEKTLTELEKEGLGNIKVYGGIVYRKMLFSINEENVAEDLLYYSPHYAVEGYNPKEEVNSKLLITQPINLEQLLTYFNFKEDLTNRDIKRIYNLFLRDESFYYKNCELFGMSKVGHNSWCTNGKNHPLPLEYYSKLSSIVSNTKKPSSYELENQPIKVKVRTFF